MLYRCVLQSGKSGDGYELSSTLCKYDLRKGYFFVRSWARVQRVRRGGVYTELIIYGGGVHIILLLVIVFKCLDTIDVCI